MACVAFFLHQACKSVQAVAGRRIQRYSLWPAHQFLGSRHLCSIERKKFNSEISEDTSMPELNLAEHSFLSMRDIVEAEHNMTSSRREHSLQSHV